MLAEISRSILALGNEAEIGRVWHESLHIATDIHGTPIALEALAGFASPQAKQGDREHALELLLMVLNHPASLQDTKNRAGHLRVEMEACLSPRQIEMARTRACDRSFDALSEEILGSDGRSRGCGEPSCWLGSPRKAPMPVTV